VKWNKRDRYSRIEGFVIVDGLDVNHVQVKAGMAWFYRYYQKELSADNRKLYAQAEDEARANKKGLWQDKNPMPSWERRQLNKLQRRARKPPSLEVNHAFNW
jgi:endonuclease YncB( thermonuclease family)